MTITHTLSVVTGEYESGGEKKKRRKYIGHMHEGKYGMYITLDASVNLAAFPRRDGDDRVMVGVFEYEKKDKAKSEDFDDDVPY